MLSRLIARRPGTGHTDGNGDDPTEPDKAPSLRLNHVGIYFASTAIARVLPFLALPIITAYVGPEDFGKWAILLVLVAFTVPLLGLMLRAGIARSFHQLGKDELATLISSAISYICVAALALGAMAMIVISLLPGQFSLGPQHFAYGLIPLIAFATAIEEIFMLILRFQKRPLLYAVFEIGGAALNIGLALILIVLAQSGWIGLVFGKLVAGGLIGLCGIVYLASHGFLRLRFDTAMFRKTLAVTLPLLPHALGSTLISMSDRLILSQMLGLEAVGVYSLGYMIGSALLLLGQAFSRTWAPWVYEQLGAAGVGRGDTEANGNEEGFDRARTIRIIYLFMAAVSVAGMALIGAAHVYIHHFVDRSFADAFEVVPWVVLAIIFQCAYFAVFPFLTHLGKTAAFAIATTCAAVVNIVATIMLVNWVGMVGAAQATTLAYAVMLVIVLIKTQKHFPLPWLAPRTTGK